jgi:hypothetical protein
VSDRAGATGARFVSIREEMSEKSTSLARADAVGTAPALGRTVMRITRAVAAIVGALVVEPLVELGARLFVALLGVDLLGALSLLARGLV